MTKRPNLIKEVKDWVAIRITEGQKTVIDKKDYDLVKMYRWRAQKTDNGCFYAVTSIKNEEGKVTIISMHRLLMEVGTGDKRLVVHKNKYGLDNTRDNLAVVSSPRQIKKKFYRNSSTKNFSTKGVSFHTKIKKWQANIVHEGKLIHIGIFETREKAIEAREAKASELFGADAIVRRKVVLWRKHITNDLEGW